MATGNDLPTLDERAGEGESLPVMDTHFPTRADFLKKINKTERNFTVKYSIITFLYIFIVSNLKSSLKIKQGKKMVPVYERHTFKNALSENAISFRTRFS